VSWLVKNEAEVTYHNDPVNLIEIHMHMSITQFIRYIVCSSKIPNGTDIIRMIAD